MSQQKAKLKTKLDSASYAIGVDISRSMKRQDIELDLNVLFAGMKDGMAGKVQLSDETMQTVLQAFQAEMMQKIQAKREKEAAENLAQGKKFLEENAKKEGVKTTGSGLQYKVLTANSNGRTPTDTSTVRVHYRGTLINGTEFDSSIKRGQPAEFPVNGVIRGWTEALKLMKTGEKFQLFIPSDLAYGAQGAPPSIPPNATLIFEVELLDIVK
ncbi:MAG: FKBP-type peptidyl-prolyl cis-trans isomerase [Bacteroidota bacterium]|nr:FKBP-type peptidyl-prolyl cis-trans isomerase [Candidatus Kapabacteria bacterium]MDW8221078.1 FKBP-type peptidyl-prolyl cis-trans isomerase [Bacteroidota bacterium]